jgi:molybdopterin converting factor subunit 1
VNRVRIKYYALLREEAGRSDEAVDTAAHTAADLYDELRGRYAFRLPRAQLRVAVNGEFADWGRTLAEDDEVVFIPPVAGG